MERALSAEWLVATRDVPGPGRPERAASLERTRARAALLAARARQRGERAPVGPALSRLAEGILPGGPTFSGGVAHGGAWLAGLLQRGAAPPQADFARPQPENQLRMARPAGRRARLPG
jgi:hypothetical protein